ncbi:MAG: ABC transporter permease, partial [Nocardioides sp.]|nr:ABC transporter permease [Nocardioides sp.]
MLTSAAGPSCYSRLTNEWICGQYLTDRKQEIIDATVQHIWITVVSVLVGLVIAFPLALLARRLPRLESLILG